MYDYRLMACQERPVAIVDRHLSELLEQESRHPSKVHRVRIDLAPRSFLTTEFRIDLEFYLKITDLHTEQKCIDCDSS